MNTHFSGLFGTAMSCSTRPARNGPALGPGAAAAALAAAFLLPGCTGTPGAGRLASTDPLVVTEDGVAGAVSPARAATIAEIRASAAAANAAPPAETPVQQTIRLAARPEPRTLAEAQAVEAELALIAERRAGASPGELGALEARAAELRRLAVQAQAASGR